MRFCVFVGVSLVENRTDLAHALKPFGDSHNSYQLLPTHTCATTADKMEIMTTNSAANIKPLHIDILKVIFVESFNSGWVCNRINIKQ